MSLFKDVIADTFLSVNVSAVLLMSSQKRTFALTFGYGKALLNPAAWEEQFGLKAALNSIGSGRVRTIDRVRFDTAQHSRIQASKEASIGDFGLDVEQDLLRAVTGVPHDSALGTHVAGRDAFQATLKIALPEIPALLGRLLDEFQKEDYKTGLLLD
jgi:uncharacterized protein (TIGR04141 family)